LYDKFDCYVNILSNNNNKIISNNWSINQESIYTTINNLVINQIGVTKGQIYFPFIYSLFIFILVNNLLGMVQRRCLTKSLFIRQQPKVNFSSLKNNSNYLNPYFITGFVDGEGCFNISIYKDSRMKTR